MTILETHTKNHTDKLMTWISPLKATSYCKGSQVIGRTNCFRLVFRRHKAPAEIQVCGDRTVSVCGRFDSFVLGHLVEPFFLRNANTSHIF